MKILKMSLLALAITITAYPSFSMNEENVSRTPFSFDFLSKKYPELINESKKPFESIETEEKPYISFGLDVEKEFVKTIKSILSTNPISKESFMLFMQLPENYVDEALQVRTQSLSPIINALPDEGFFKVFKKRKITVKNIFEDIILASELIFEHVKNQSMDKKSIVLSLGRTPCLIHEIHKEILKIENCTNQIPIHLNFSGTPDMDVERNSSFYQNHKKLVRARNIVTKEKLEHYFQYMDTKNWDGAEKIYIVDMIGKGGSLNSFLKILHVYFSQKKMKMPEIEFLCLIQGPKYIEPHQFMSYEEKTPNTGIFHFFKDESSNFAAFHIPTILIPVEELTLSHLLDNPTVQDLASFGTEYPAQKWTENYDEEREKGGKYWKNLKEYVSKNSKIYINFHKK